MSERSWPAPIEQLLARLADGTAAPALVELAFDFCIDEPVERYISPERLLSHMDHLLRDAVVRRVVTEHGRPFFDLELQRSEKRQDHLGDWLTEEATDELRTLVGRPVRLRRAFLEDLVQQEAVRHMLRSIIEEALTRFVDSFNPAKKGGLIGSMGRKTAGVANSMKKGIFGKVGSQLQGAMSRAAKSFVDGSMELMLRRTVEIMSSPEMAERLGELNRTGFDEALKLSTHYVMRSSQRLPLDELAHILPELIIHNLAREDLRRTYLDEVEAILAVEGKKTVRELLEESDAVDYWRNEIVELASPLVMELVLTDGLQRWLEHTLAQ